MATHHWTSSLPIVALSTVSISCRSINSEVFPQPVWVAIVDQNGRTIIDCWVKPYNCRVVNDYETLTERTGIDPYHFLSPSAWTLEDIQPLIVMAVTNKRIVGHQLWRDFNVLGLKHAKEATRDVALYQPFRDKINNVSQANHMLGLPMLYHRICGGHCQFPVVRPLENALVALQLYRSVDAEWESAMSPYGDQPCGDLPMQDRGKFNHVYN
ncbi:uncharacterized protein STEHIDRAFT_114336 [Stereum hirsutum FP-91666 SS1]|uniref:uncharacterized protein n=1 Tax=Stereum hirsutum (strain FP-91666) TaxID=721885 RepID=UPI0004449FAF|nr:uncharacterized protein STEHIDRAFT_114336 [Stereum hirsutum FP-91666 SS1]EIM82418.1 hypothetical protein STEHIDRAFT_114336 [Stereum hirsutum FP-91666 SS1]